MQVRQSPLQGSWPAPCPHTGVLMALCQHISSGRTCTVSLSWQACCHTASMSLTSDTLLLLLCQPCLISLPASLPPSITWCFFSSSFFFFFSFTKHPHPHASYLQGSHYLISAPVSALLAHHYFCIKLRSYDVQTWECAPNSTILCVLSFLL